MLASLSSLIQMYNLFIMRKGYVTSQILISNIQTIWRMLEQFRMSDQHFLNNKFMMNQQISNQNSPEIEGETIQFTSLARVEVPIRCPYCNGNQQYHWAFTKQHLRPDIYELMVSRGWIRCGTYYYKIDPINNCCRQFNRRMNVQQFRITKSQKRTMFRIMPLVSDSKPQFNPSEDPQKVESKTVLPLSLQTLSIMPVDKKYPSTEIDEKDISLMASINAKLLELFSTTSKQFKNNLLSLASNPAHLQEIELFCEVDREKVRYFAAPPSEQFHYYSNLVQLLYARNKQILKKCKKSDFFKCFGAWVEERAKTWEEMGGRLKINYSGYLLYDICDKEPKKVKAKIQQKTGQNKKKQARKKREKKKQQKVEETEEQTNPKEDEFVPLIITEKEIRFGDLLIKLLPASCTIEKWRLYEQYCIKVHERMFETKTIFNNFLCKQALNYVEETRDGENRMWAPTWRPSAKQHVTGPVTKFMGCHHMEYYLHNELVAVGVVDILPTTLESAYFFYKPELQKYRIGVVSALIQIEYTRWMNATFPEFKYYNMGPYLQNNKKMSYKAQFEPFELLCPVNWQFVLFDEKTKETISLIEYGELYLPQISGPEACLAEDMRFQGDESMFALENMKIKKINDLHLISEETILTSLTSYCLALGKELFTKFTFQI